MAMSKPRQLSALIGIISLGRAKRAQARARAFFSWQARARASRRRDVLATRNALAAVIVANRANGDRLRVLAATIASAARASRGRVRACAWRRWVARTARARPLRVHAEALLARREYDAFSPDRAPARRDEPSPDRAPARREDLDRASARRHEPSPDRAPTRHEPSPDAEALADGAARVAALGPKMRRLYDAYCDDGPGLSRRAFDRLARDCGISPALASRDAVARAFGPSRAGFDGFCVAIARIGLTHGGGSVHGETDPLRSLFLVVAASDGFYRVQRRALQDALGEGARVEAC
mmetsp:Transcript_9442/g.29356  ORF Transcript_9442/g.29356 Transcript_9442/m.29356 type:complete len:295 (+) Transcript_9442:558-1442(+)